MKEETKRIPPRIMKRMEVDPFQPGPPVSLPTPIALRRKNAQVFPKTYSLINQHNNLQLQSYKYSKTFLLVFHDSHQSSSSINTLLDKPKIPTTSFHSQINYRRGEAMNTRPSNTKPWNDIDKYKSVNSNYYSLLNKITDIPLRHKPWQNARS